MRARGVQIGRVQLFWWAGSWSIIDTFPCAHCHNLYVGPFGIELLRDDDDEGYGRVR